MNHPAAPATAPGHRVPPLGGVLPPHCQSDLNTLRSFIRDAVTRATPADAVPPPEFRHVLVTGATGFLGRFLLRDLLTLRPDLTVHCIVRGETAEGGFERLRATMKHAETWDDGFAPRIRVHAGDITQPRLGLSRPDFDRLSEEVDAVYHLAATLNLTAGYPAIRRDNVFSLRNVLELCLGVRYKHLFLVSTMGIFPEYFCAFAHEYRESRIGDQMQPDLASMKRTFPLGLVGYPWSKLVAEQSVLFAHAAGLPTAIFRLAQTSMASTGYTQPRHRHAAPLLGGRGRGRVPPGVHTPVQLRPGRHPEPHLHRDLAQSPAQVHGLQLLQPDPVLPEHPHRGTRTRLPGGLLPGLQAGLPGEG